MRSSIFVLATLILAASGAPLASPSPQKGLGGAGAGGCKKIAFIFARGSTEGGTMGASVGPAFQRALEAKFPGQVKTMGVKYPASIQGAFTGAMNPSQAEGSKDMAAKAKEIMSSCPDSKIVLAGYSQGAEQVHGALQKANLGQEGAKIVAAITYGDPIHFSKALGGWGCLPEARTKVFCNTGDGVCGGAFAISMAHLSYTTNGDIAKGAAFALQFINDGNIKGGEGGCKYGSSMMGGGGGAAPAKASSPAPAKGLGGLGALGGIGKGTPPKGKGTGSKGSGGAGETAAPPPKAEADEEAASGRKSIRVNV
ncbi:hypothetical protein FKW77_001236 [Venturia effusa]|uniref:cutinase n=1 Tax=Venturia effusa TaxID=50376 RepID=A0A517LPK3_9PEZI|nr:hypothetical protein FKW77_001236 [Venturia effusa]